MAKKSKFLTFILSGVPGLGHVYLGFNTRGGVFFLAELVVAFLIVILGPGMNYNNAPFLAVLMPIIWLVALVDSMVLVDKYNWLIQNGKNREEIFESMEIEKQNKKVIAMVLSIIPGTGHMYLGLQRQGLQLITLFFMSFFLTDWLRVSLFMVIIPIVWFYSLFDVMNKASGTDPQEDDDVLLVSWFKGGSPLIKNTSKFIAYILISIGGFLLFDRIIMPEIDRLIRWNIREYLQTVIVALLFIIGGIKLLAGGKRPSNTLEGDEYQ